MRILVFLLVSLLMGCVTTPNPDPFQDVPWDQEIHEERHKE